MTIDGATTSALYRTIQSQPAIVRAVLTDSSEDAARAADLLRSARRVFLAGTGTSSHAAIVGEHLLRLAGVDAFSTTNFDFVNYPRRLHADDVVIVISHRGSKRYGKQAIEIAHAAGASVIGITGQGSPMEGPAVVIHTAPSEVSSTHTASYTGNMAALARIAVHLGERTGADVDDLRAALGRLPEALKALLTCEEAVRGVAVDLAARGRLVLTGAGPNAATAREGALKVKESSYLVAEGFELETALHGGLQAIEAGDVAVILAAHGPALSRTVDVVRALTLIGARLLVVADERVAGEIPLPEGGSPLATLITFEAVPEALSPILAVVPLQLLADLTATLRGSNADSFRADEPVYKRANASYAL